VPYVHVGDVADVNDANDATRHVTGEKLPAIPRGGTRGGDRLAISLPAEIAGGDPVQPVKGN